MVKMLLENLNKIYISFILILLIGCKNYTSLNENQFNEIKFNNSSFHRVVDQFIVDINTYPVDKFKEIIVTLNYYRDGRITISLVNYPPFETVNLVAVNKYKGYILYFYSPENFIDKVDNMIDVDNGKIENVTLKPVEEKNIDFMYSYEYVCKNGEFILMK